MIHLQIQKSLPSSVNLKVPSAHINLPRNVFICDTAIRRIVSLSGLRARVLHVGTISQSSFIYAVILFLRRLSISQWLSLQHKQQIYCCRRANPRLHCSKQPVSQPTTNISMAMMEETLEDKCATTVLTGQSSPQQILVNGCKVLVLKRDPSS